MEIKPDRKRQAIPLRDILPAVLKDISRISHHEQIELEQVWADIMGPGTGGAAFRGFRDGTVYITVDSPARLYYWKQRRTTVLKRFQERRSDVSNLIFKIGNVT